MLGFTPGFFMPNSTAPPNLRIIWRGVPPLGPCDTISKSQSDPHVFKRSPLTPYHTTECILPSKGEIYGDPSIGQVARRAGVGVETVRFYEREGLLEEPVRRASGYRQYAGEAVKHIRFIKRAQQLGFSLKEIRELLTLRVDAETSCEQVKERTAAKLAEVEQKIAELQYMRQALLQVAFLCEEEGPKSRCPLLDALDRDSGTVET